MSNNIAESMAYQQRYQDRKIWEIGRSFCEGNKERLQKWLVIGVRHWMKEKKNRKN